MRRRVLLCIATAVAVSMSGRAFAQATIEGRVELPKSHSAPVMTKRYEVVSRGGVLATNPPLAVVYLEGAESKGGSLPTKQVSQKEMNFVPTLLAVQVGTTVEFPNEDDTYHNIFSYSPAKRFDLGRMSARFLRSSSTKRGSSLCVAISTSTCVD